MVASLQKIRSPPLLLLLLACLCSASCYGRRYKAFLPPFLRAESLTVTGDPHKHYHSTGYTASGSSFSHTNSCTFNIFPKQCRSTLIGNSFPKCSTASDVPLRVSKSFLSLRTSDSPPLSACPRLKQRHQQQERQMLQCQQQILSTVSMVSVRRYRVQQGPWPLSVNTSASAIIRRNNKKRQLAADYAPLRRLYLRNMKESKSLDEQIHWHILLQQLPRDSSPTRYRRRCISTGRARGVYRHFGLCRHKIKEMIDNMMIPGWTKAEW